MKEQEVIATDPAVSLQSRSSSSSSAASEAAASLVVYCSEHHLQTLGQV